MSEQDKQAAWLLNSCAIKVYKNENVSLTKSQYATRDDPDFDKVSYVVEGSTVDVLCWRIAGDIHVHPDRWDQFCAAFGYKPTTAAGGEGSK